MKHLFIVLMLFVLSVVSSESYSQLTGKCVEGNCKNGYGRLVTKTGEEYRGNIKDGP